MAGPSAIPPRKKKYVLPTVRKGKGPGMPARPKSAGQLQLRPAKRRRLEEPKKASSSTRGGKGDDDTAPPDPEEDSAGRPRGPAREDAAVRAAAGNKKGSNGTPASTTVNNIKGKPAGLSTSKETHAKQRELAKERKASRPLADEVQRAKKIWERLRIKSKVPREERQSLIQELFGIIQGRIKDFVLKHDAVRAVQTALKYGTMEQKRQIATELRGTFAHLAEGRYSKFLLAKMMVEGDQAIRDMVVPEFYGRVRRLINHPEGSWILDDIYRAAASEKQKAIILREWYGPEFALEAGGGPGAAAAAEEPARTAELGRIIAADPNKRGTMMKHLLEMINTLIQKRMTGFTSLHDAMLQYFLNARPGTDEFSEFVEIVKGDEAGDLVKNMAFTQSGARLVCLLLAHGTAKDRKQLLKPYKDTFVLMSADQHAHRVILAAYDLIDDTKLTSKTIFPDLLGDEDDGEIEQNVVGIVNNPNGRITLLYLLEGTSPVLFPETQCTDLSLLREIHEIRLGTSKKEPETRRRELVAAISPYLIRTVSTCTSPLVSNPFGCRFITSVMLEAVGDKRAALEAVAATAHGWAKPEPAVAVAPPAASAEETQTVAFAHQISQNASWGRMLKTLVSGGRFDKSIGKVTPVDPPLDFSNILYPHIKDKIVDWATGPNSFVVLGLMESENFEAKEEVRKKLQACRKMLEKASVTETEEQRAGREKLAGDNEIGGGRKRKIPKERAERKVGNQGSRLLLETL